MAIWSMDRSMSLHASSAPCAQAFPGIDNHSARAVEKAARVSFEITQLMPAARAARRRSIAIPPGALWRQMVRHAPVIVLAFRVSAGTRSLGQIGHMGRHRLPDGSLPKCPDVICAHCQRGHDRVDTAFELRLVVKRRLEERGVAWPHRPDVLLARLEQLCARLR